MCQDSILSVLEIYPVLNISYVYHEYLNVNRKKNPWSTLHPEYNYCDRTLRPKVREFDTKYKVPLITYVTKNLPDGEHKGRVLFTIYIYDQSSV